MATKAKEKSSVLIEEKEIIKLPDNIIYDWREAMNIYNDDSLLAIDLETTGLNPWRDRIAVVGMYGTKSKRPAVLHHPGKEPWPREFMDWLVSETPNGETRLYITHNGVAFDIPYLFTHGMDVHAVNWWDTLISEQVSLISGRKNISVSLAQTAKRRLRREVKKSIDHESWKNPELSDEQIDYVVADISFLHKIREQHLKECGTDSRERALRVEMALIPVTTRMILNGFPVDTDLFDHYITKQQALVEESYDTLVKTFGSDVNFDSPIQLKKAFLNAGLAVENTRAETIADMVYKYEGTPVGDVLQALQTYKHAQKRVKMYSEEWREKNLIWDQRLNKFVLHSRYKQAGTDTGRYSSADINMQQIPKDMRDIFGNVPDKSIVSMDFKGIEAAVAASITGDQAFIAALETGDIHTFVASQILNIPMEDVTKDQRQVAKAATFTLIFAGSPVALVRSAKMYGVRLDMTQAEAISNNFYSRFPEMARAVRKARTDSRKDRLSITLPTGLRRQLLSSAYMRQGDEMDDPLSPQRILNTRVQGTAAAGLKYSLILMLNIPYKEGCLADVLIGTIHDEIVALVDDEDTQFVVDKMRECMLEGMARALKGYTKVSVEVEEYIGKVWGK